MSGSNDLLLQIARCDIFHDYINSNKLTDKCKDIVQAQNSIEHKNRHVPTPWQGDIECSPILFISSNPSPGKSSYGTVDWISKKNDDEICEFYTNSLEDSDTTFKFWKSVQRLAAEILSTEPQNISPGTHYTLTEVVHCNSDGEKGVKRALNTCTERYLEGILRFSPASIIVLLGRYARRAFNDIYHLNLEPCGKGKSKQKGHFYQTELGGTSRIIINLPHPSAYQFPRHIVHWLTAKEIATINKNLSYQMPKIDKKG